MFLINFNVFPLFLLFCRTKEMLIWFYTSILTINSFRFKKPSGVKKIFYYFIYILLILSHRLFSTCGLWGNSLMTLSNDYFLNRIFLLFGYNDMNVDTITLLNFTGSKKKTQFLSVYLPNKDSVKSTIQWQDQKNYFKKL